MIDFFLIIPAYNASGWINDALKSVCISDVEFRPSKVVIADDGSTDETETVVRNFFKNLDFPELIYTKLATHKNQYYAKNGALSVIQELIRKKNKEEVLIGFLDSDDICYRDRFKRQITLLNSNSKIWAVGGGCHNFEKVSEADDSQSAVAWPMLENPLIQGSRQYGIGLWNATAIYRWSVIETLGSFDFTPTMGDTEWFVRLVWATVLHDREIRNVQTPVIHRRVHPAQVSSNASNSQSPIRVAYDAMCRQKFIYLKTLNHLKILQPEHLHRYLEPFSAAVG